MPHDLYKDLAWLPDAPANFGDRCRALGTFDSVLGNAVRALASHSLDENQLARLARAIDRERAKGHSLAPLAPIRIGVLGNGTIDFIVPALIATAARHGLDLDCVRGDYDQYLQDALLAGSAINRAKPDVVLLALDHRALSLLGTPGDEEAAKRSVAAAMDLLDTIRSAIRIHSGATCIVQTLAQTPESLFGSLDRALPGTLRNLIDEVNRRIIASLAGTVDLLLDISALAETVGVAEWHSPAQWNLAKLPFAGAYVPLYADHVTRLLSAMRGKTRRCLVLDLDNTVWGGVIGDDGLEGIKVSQGDPTGEAHLSVQQSALVLRARGIVLAVSSKNTDSVARQPFIDHPDMLLKEEHIAVFQSNWEDKATNIRAIAEALSLGLDSLVFLDDNPAERALIRSELPEVAVPELDDDPATFARTLAAGGYFEAVRFLDEDRNRAAMYQSNARRLDAMQKVGDVDTYLRSLDMKLHIRPFDRTARARVTQLINKSNQFNLTTRRYTESQVAELEGASGIMTLQARLVDRFGDNGIISVVICRKTASAEWTIDTWLMSCRVLGRKVEQAVLAEIIFLARQQGITTLVGVYRPTDRNDMVRDHYRKLGFHPTGIDTSEASCWILQTDAKAGDIPIEIEREAIVQVFD